MGPAEVFHIPITARLDVDVDRDQSFPHESEAGDGEVPPDFHAAGLEGQVPVPCLRIRYHPGKGT